ncbi:TLC domain-containing protein [Chytridium lagenaria]|nr:TLC domain-containing protein [Chytridium lagenaria]
MGIFFNKDLVYPQDVYLLGVWTLVWAVAHASFKAWIKPVALHLVRDPPTPPSKTDQKRIHKSKRIQWIKERKTGKPEKKDAPTTTVADKKLPKNFKKFVTILDLTPRLYFQGWPEEHNLSFMLRVYAFSVFFDPKQKDIVALLIHHITTVVIILASYFLGLYRIGAVILLLHDVSDPFMEIAKMFVYTGNQRMADLFFAQFAVVFLVTRNFIFPVYVITASPLYAYHEDGSMIPYGHWEMNWACIALLCVLCALHYYWGYLIVKMVFKALVEKKVEGDIRDDDEDDD